MSLPDAHIMLRCAYHRTYHCMICVRISYWKHRTETNNSELKQSKYRISVQNNVFNILPNLAFSGRTVPSLEVSYTNRANFARKPSVDIPVSVSDNFASEVTIGSVIKIAQNLLCYMKKVKRNEDMKIDGLFPWLLKLSISSGGSRIFKRRVR